MEVGANIFADLDAPIQESYISQMERLLSGNHDDYQLYREIWNQIQEDTDADRREAIAGDVREELADAISRNQNPDHLDPLIAVFQSLTDHVGDTDGQRLMERMSKQLTENNLNDNQKGAVIAQLATFDGFFEKEAQILDRLENLLSQTNNDNVLQAARELIDRLEKLDAADQDRLNKIREEYME